MLFDVSSRGFWGPHIPLYRAQRAEVRVGLVAYRDGDTICWRVFHVRKGRTLEGHGVREWLDAVFSDTTDDAGVSKVARLSDGEAVRMWAKVRLTGKYDYWGEFSDDFKFLSLQCF